MVPLDPQYKVSHTMVLSYMRKKTYFDLASSHEKKGRRSNLMVPLDLQCKVSFISDLSYNMNRTQYLGDIAHFMQKRPLTLQVLRERKVVGQI